MADAVAASRLEGTRGAGWKKREAVEEEDAKEKWGNDTDRWIRAD